MNKLIWTLLLGFFILSCGKDPNENNSAQANSEQAPVELPDNMQSADPNLNEKLKTMSPNANNDQPVEIKKVALTHPLHQSMVKKGQRVYQNKCASCHNVTSEKLKATGFADITQRRKPEWIMNLLTYPSFKGERSAMKCWVREEGNLLNIVEARDFLEFVRFNDGEE